MDNLVYSFTYNNSNYDIIFVFVAGTTANDPFLFGLPGEQQAIHIGDFFISETLVTQATWKFVMGDAQDHSQNKGDNHPVEHVSWNDIAMPGGFLEKLNRQWGDKAVFRLPTETEWEYAARGGLHRQDDFMFAGSNNPDEVAWYLENSLNHSWPVAQKKSNQLGIYDMNGNLWEWCQDWFVRNVREIPNDGSAYLVPTKDKVLRGGCHHNGAFHCTNTKRYEIPPDCFDGCIGFRLAFILNHQPQGKKI